MRYISPPRRFFSYRSLLCSSLLVFWLIQPTLSGQGAPAPDYLVAIDPGHGGEDQGILHAESGLSEKELVLDLTQKLQREFSKETNIRIALTRDQDQPNPLFARAEKANRMNAGVLLSLHAAWEHRRPSGIRIFFCSRSEAEKPGAESKPAMELTSWEESCLPFRNRSNDLALLLQSELASLYLNPPEIHSLPLLLLQSSAMPSLLIEVGNLADPLDVELLKTEDFRLRLVRSLKTALLRFSTENPQK